MTPKETQQLAEIIIENVGGKNNIKDLTHCFTRLRFRLNDEQLANDDLLKSTQGVMSVIKASGQYQVVIGNGVSTVFDAVMQQLGNAIKTEESVEKPTQNPAKGHFFSYYLNQLIGTITGSMTPVIGVIAAAGIIKGLLALFTLPQLGALLNVHDMFYISVSAIADAAFYFLPVLVGFSAARYMNGDPIITAVIGCVLTYPQIVAWGKLFTPMFEVSGLQFEFLNYTYSIFPMILAAWFAKKMTDWLKAHLPSYLHMIFIPLITILIVSAITLVITGPIIQGLANGIAVFVNWLVQASGWIGGLVIGGFYQILVIFGLHWGVVPLIAQEIAGVGASPLNAIVSGTMVAQGAAVLAVAIKSRKDQLKSLGFAATISAFCGVTEPTIYGINLRYRRVFVCGLLGSAVSGCITGFMHGNMFGFTGSLIGFSSFFDPKDPSNLHSFYAFLISSSAAIIVSFVATWVWGYNDKMEMSAAVEKKQNPSKKIQH